MSDQTALIADIEAEIEALAEQAARCRKVAAAAKACAGIGGALTFLVLTGLWPLPALALVLGLAAALGGVALLGSNRGTQNELTARIGALEARRAELIDGLRFRVVEGGLSRSALR